MSHLRAAALFASALGSLAGCGLLPHVEAPPECGFPPGTELAFAGVTTAEELGLQSFNAGVRNWVYVTAAPVPRLGDAQEARMACRLWGSGGPPEMIPVPPGWVPPPRP